MKDFWDEYLNAERIGVKSRWKRALDEFIKEYFKASEEERLVWLANNIQLFIDQKVPLRNPLFEQIIFPYLFEGYQKQDLARIKQLILLFGHVDKLKAYRQGTLPLTFFALLDRGLSLNPNDKELLLIAYKARLSELEYSVHELPLGICADAADCSKLLEVLSDFEELCKRLGKDEAEFINMCRWHYNHYPLYLSYREQQKFQSYKEYIQFYGESNL